MDLLTLFALWLFSRCGRGEGGELAPVPATPGGQPGWPGSPIVLPTTTPPWPQTPPTDLPPFPGAAWEFDEPPPPAVQRRAGQLVDELWARGSGAYRVERTDARWIAYQAQIVASGKKGVVAYRLKRPGTALPPGATASRAAPRRPAVARRAPAPRATAPAAPRASAPPASSPRVSVPAAPTLNLPVLRRGAGAVPGPPSNDVRLLQQRLGIPADGRFGGGTDTAVREFQRRNGLQVDGVVGQKTWAKLFAVRA